MQMHTNEVKPADLGIIGEQHWRRCFHAVGADPLTFIYKRVFTVDDEKDVPVVIEVAFAYAAKNQRRLFTGVNFSPAIVNPFRQIGNSGEGLERVLAGQRVELTEPVIVAVHMTAPVITYLDRGKSSIALGGGERSGEEEQESTEFYLSEVTRAWDDTPADKLIAAVKSVTKQWLKQRQAEDRHHAAVANREATLQRSRQSSVKSATFDVMEQAYLAASTNNTLIANARQVMYAARPGILKRTNNNKPLDDNYFTQNLLPDYIAEFNPPWKGKIAYDERGHFSEPHTGKAIGLGTVAVRHYLGTMCPPELRAGFTAKLHTHGPDGRFGGVFFIEKEGFDALFAEAQIAERHDLADMSCKGISVTAARELADQMCAAYNIPLYLLTDFDKSGFVGSGTFERDNRRYTYQNEIEVVRLGLRLADVQAIAAARGVGIEDFREAVSDKGSPEARRANLKLNGATDEEAEFLLHHRVELNALRSDELLAFVERKLAEHGVHKIVPRRKLLAETYRHFTRGEQLRQLVEAELAKHVTIKVPADLVERVNAYLAEHPECPWDAAVATIAGWRGS